MKTLATFWRPRARAGNLLTGFFLLRLTIGAAQATLTDQSLKYTPTLPPPPQAAALGKFGQTPVGLYTGVAQISIPIYTVRLPGLELPVSLDYHAGGIRVSETASNVGLGWALRAGGMISSTVIGTADFAQSDRGYAHQIPYVPLPADRQLAPQETTFNIYTGQGNADYEFLKKLTACPTVAPSGSGGPEVV